MIQSTVQSKKKQSSEAHEESKQSLRTWLYLLKCAKWVEREMSDRLRENFKSSLSRFDVMDHLVLAGEEGLNTSSLANQLLASKGNITRLLDRMEQDGLIKRKSVPNDRRVSKIYITDKGSELFKQMAPMHENWSHEIFSSIPQNEKESLLKVLKAFYKNLDKDS